MKTFFLSETQLIHDITGSTLKFIYDVVIRYPIEGKLTNFNIYVTKLGLAKITNHAVYEGETIEPEAKPASVNETHMIRKQAGATKLQKEVAKLCRELPNKILKRSPATKVMCKVTNVVSPDEMWVQDVVDAKEGGYYQEFQRELSKKWGDFLAGKNISWGSEL